MQVVVILRTLLQDRMAALNGRTVKHVLQQDQAAFIRLIGLSTLQVVQPQALCDSVFQPSLFGGFCLWRRTCLSTFSIWGYFWLWLRTPGKALLLLSLCCRQQKHEWICLFIMSPESRMLGSC